MSGLLPPAMRARRTAIVLSGIAILFSLAFGWAARHSYEIRAHEELAMLWLTGALTLLLFALLFRIGAGICELLWLERTWSNLPKELRNVGPIQDVNSGMLIGLSFVPVVAWFWKFGLVRAVSDGLEKVRLVTPFRAPVPRKLGLAAVMLGWLPPLNIYLAPFLWEMFARRIDAVCLELGA